MREREIEQCNNGMIGIQFLHICEIKQSEYIATSKPETVVTSLKEPNLS